MAKLNSSNRAKLPDSAFAYIDARGRRRLPIHDEAHLRNALARFNQVAFENDAAKNRTRKRLLNAAKKFGIVPVGFIQGQLEAATPQPLPTGFVTFMMTDIEGSTALLRQLGDRYGELLNDIRTLLRSAVAQKCGHEIDARADEFFAVFESATDAIEAGVAIQHALQAKDWPEKLAVRVRMGMHSGRPTLTDTGYIGLCVHTAARVSAAAHGGQIIVSDETMAAIGAALLHDISFQNLGRYQLAGLAEAGCLYQVEVDGLPTSFPPLRAGSVS
jgi:class 3 adenylate cyclase